MTPPPDDDNQGNDDDSQVKQIHVPGSVLPPGVCSEQDNIFVKVRNQGDTAELVAVYLDVVPPGGMSNPGGCQPSGRIIQSTVVLAAAGQIGAQVNVSAGLVTFACSNPQAVAGLSYTFIAVVDVHADDLAACGPGALLSLTCFNALANDVSVSNDFRLSTTGATVLK